MALTGFAVLLGAPLANAEWQQIPTPPGGIGDFSAASADALIVSPPSNFGELSFNVTNNRGTSWSAVELPGFYYGSIVGAAPDGSFRVVAAKYGAASLQEFQVFKVDGAGFAEPLGSTISTSDGRFSNHFGALDDRGYVWIPYQADGAWKVEIVAPDGSEVSRELPNLEVEFWDVAETAFGPRAIPVRGPGFASFEPRRGTYKFGLTGNFEPAEGYPVEFAEGEFWYSPSALRASWDAGAHWSELSTRPAEVVSGTGAPARFLAIRGAITQRNSSFLYAAAGSPLPTGLREYGIVDAGNALAGSGEGALYIEPLPLEAAPTTIGQVPADSADLINRANLFRADAGLPPLTGEAGISLAAHNHSAYTALHPDELEGLSAHGEQPGHAGFTGVEPWDRCEAVGARCGSEVMYPPVPDPVGGWLATVYHRSVPGGPEVGLIGGGKADGGWFVLDAGDDRNVLIQPFGYPNGRWRGEESWSGEIPDPTEECRKRGEPISYPLGVTVTLFLPKEAGSVKKIEVRKHGDSSPLTGCLLGKSFIPDDPLKRGQSYDVHAEWQTETNPEADGTTTPGVTLSHDWSFYVQPDDYGARNEQVSRDCQALGLRTIKSVAPTHRRGRRRLALGIEEKVTFKQAAKVRLRHALLNYWKAGKRYSTKLRLGRLQRHEARVGRVSFLRFRLPSKVVRRVIPGEPAELWLKFTGRRIDTCKRVISVKRVRKVELGWVHLRGPAAWVSASRKHPS